MYLNSMCSAVYTELLIYGTLKKKKKKRIAATQVVL